MTSFKTRLLETFKNLKSDALPRAPRPETYDTDDAPGCPIVEEVTEPDSTLPGDSHYTKKGEKPKKFTKSFFKPENNKSKDKPDSEQSKDAKENVVINTQATGDVTHIVNSKDIHIGNVMYFGPQQDYFQGQSSAFEERVQMDNLIALVMEAKILPEHEYIDYISKNLGKNWQSIFRTLGYTKGQIETMEIDNAKNGVAEARYKLLLDWVRNEEKATLGRLATHLWNEGEREVVKGLSIIYKKNRK